MSKKKNKGTDTRVWIWEGGEYECPHMELSEFDPGRSDAVGVTVPVKMVNRWFKAMSNFMDVENEMAAVYTEARKQLRDEARAQIRQAAGQPPDRPAPLVVTKQRYIPGLGWVATEVR